MDNESFTFEGREYVNPTVSRDEQLGFIDTLRDVQARNNQQIAEETQALGSQVPSNLGGLAGAQGVWEARYQTPQVASTVADLKLQAQQAALNTVLSNQQAMWENRYNQGQNAMNRARTNYSTTPISTYPKTPKGDVAVETSDDIAVRLKEVDPNSTFGIIIRDSSKYIPGYSEFVSGITGATEQERRAKALAESIKRAQERRKQEKK